MRHKKNPRKRGFKFYNNIYYFDCSDCSFSTVTSMSSAIEGLLNIAVTANINTANITVVSLKPLEDDLFIFIPAFQLCPNFITCFSTKFTQRLLQVLLHPKMQRLQCCVFFSYLQPSNLNY